MACIVVQPGLFTTVQDLGRVQWQHLGVPVSGVMDKYAARIANILVGNPPDTPLLEATLKGPSLLFNEPACIAITGSDMQPLLNNKPLPLWHSIYVPANSLLELTGYRNGMYTYLSVKGGIELPKVLGSYSTYTTGNMGGYLGRPLRRNDKLIFPGFKHEDYTSIGLVNKYVPTYTRSPIVRVIEGLQWEQFTEESKLKFQRDTYLITKDANRQGIRLRGTPLLRLNEGELITEMVTAGAIQVPPNGQPIILMADSQTAGGYPKIGQIISVDLPRLAQSRPGTSIRFRMIPLAKAQKMWIEQERFFRRIQKGLEIHQ